MTATSSQTKFVVARSTSDAQAGRTIQSNRRPIVGWVVDICELATGVWVFAAIPDSAPDSGRIRIACQATMPQSNPNTAKPMDQSVACVSEVKAGTNTNGKVKSATSEPKFERAYSRYGDRVGQTLANHACNSGPVVESMK